MDNNEKFFMQRALVLAKKAEGRTSPNPLVGCVITKKGKVVAEGWHKKAGLPHAEKVALKKAGKRAKGSTMYVTLEPCSHFGKTPPCADAVIKAGVKRVVAAMKDPFSLVSGRGFRKLRAAGIKVETGLLQKEAEELNSPFIKNVTKHTPYVILKAGISADGKIALKNGRSKWITSERSRQHAQSLRKKCDAILVGINTVIADNPRLDCRTDKTKKLKKVVLDTKGRIPEGAKIFRDAGPGNVLIFTTLMSEAKINRLVKRGVNVIIVRNKSGITPQLVLKELFLRGIMSVLVEGGSRVATSFLKAKLADEIYLYIAPSIIGKDGLSYFGDMSFKQIRQIFRIKTSGVEKIGDDILLKGRVNYV